MSLVNVIIKKKQQKSECVNTWEFLQSLAKELKVMMILPLKNIFYSAITHLVLILATNNNDFEVTLMESLLINRDHPPFNKNKQHFKQ